MELVDRVRLRPLVALLRGEVEIPPANGTVRTVGADDEVVRRRQFPDPHEGRPIGQRRPEREDVGDSPGIELARRPWMPEQRLGLGREAEIAAVRGEEERTNSEAIPRQEELLALPIPDREREVAVQTLEEVRPPLLVRVGDHLRIRLGREAVAERLELLAKLDVVVDLAVLHHPEAPALVGDRLVAAVEVDDRESSVRHPEAGVEIEADSVGTAMPELARHLEQKLARDSLASVDTGQTTHPHHRRAAVRLPQGACRRGERV